MHHLWCPTWKSWKSNLHAPKLLVARLKPRNDAKPTPAFLAASVHRKQSNAPETTSPNKKTEMEVPTLITVIVVCGCANTVTGFEADDMNAKAITANIQI